MALQTHTRTNTYIHKHRHKHRDVDIDTTTQTQRHRHHVNMALFKKQAPVHFKCTFLAPPPRKIPCFLEFPAIRCFKTCCNISRTPGVLSNLCSGQIITRISSSCVRNSGGAFPPLPWGVPRIVCWIAVHSICIPRDVHARNLWQRLGCCCQASPLHWSSAIVEQPRWAVACDVSWIVTCRRSSSKHMHWFIRLMVSLVMMALAFGVPKPPWKSRWSQTCSQPADIPPAE